MKTHVRTAVAGAIAVSGLFAAAPAFAQQARIGSLQCDVAPGVGMVVASSKALNCMFYPDDGARPERYVGTFNRIGLDLGATGPGQFNWIVFAPTDGAPRGAIAGSYGGVGVAATPGVGFGANAMIGGSDRTVSLQPISVQAQVGLDVAAGMTAMDLQAAPEPVRRLRRVR